MPAESKSSIQLANKYIMKNSTMKRTSTYNRIVKFHDEYMIAHNGIVSVPVALSKTGSIDKYHYSRTSYGNEKSWKRLLHIDSNKRTV